jgi:signal transduction histidine kinase
MNLFHVARRSPVVVPLACIAAVAIMFVSEGSYWRASEVLRDLQSMTATRATVRQLQMSLLDAETGQRGYLLTSRKDYLEPYLTALPVIDESFRLLQAEHGQQADSRAALTHLRALVGAKLTELETTIQLFDAGRRDDAMELILASSGKAQMDDFRVVVADLLRFEAQHFAARRDVLHQTLLISRLGLAALSAISLLALFLYLRQTLTLKQQQLDLKRMLELERDRLELEAVQHTAQLTELTKHLLTAREDERGRLARNLHDELGALLTSAKLDAARIKSRLAGIAPEALERLAHLVETLNASIALGRDIIEDLRPSTLSNLGLVPTLEILVREFAEAKGLKVTCALEPVRLSAATELVVYRFVQEATTNISKYARARQIWISLGLVDGQVLAAVRDDGIGFDATAKPKSAYGLVGMRFRAEAEGGHLTVVSTPGQGALVQLSLPEGPAEDAANAQD